MNKYLTKIISIITILSVFFSPTLISAETYDEFIARIQRENSLPQNNPNIISPTGQFIESQIQNSVITTSATSSSIQSTSALAGSAVGAASCLGAQVVSQAITTAVSNAVSSGISKVTDSILNIPVAESGNVGANITAETSARVGTVVSFGGIGGLALPSWDSMAYCIINTMIIYIADSTIAWVNTGFDGNPAFLNNPDQFFKDLANQEKAAFLQGLAYGVNSGVCGVFKSTMVSAILSRYNKNQTNTYRGYQQGGYYNNTGANNNNMCPFDQAPNQLNAFVGGSFTEGGGWDTWFRLTQSNDNNPYSTFFNTEDRLNNQVESIQISQNRELTWNNGYLSFRKCENNEKDKRNCPITTPGTVIQNKLNETLNLGTNRLVLADKFDQVVTAVVDQLITTAINKTLETVNN